jgi:hypothetical protein
MITTMRQGKQNQHGKIEYMGCIRNINPVLCPLSALAFYFFDRWGKQSFPSFKQPEDYYNQFVFPGSIKVPERSLSYRTQFDWSKRMFQGVGIHSKETTHSPRKQSARHAELGGVSESQIRRAGRWNTDAMTGLYSSCLFVIVRFHYPSEPFVMRFSLLFVTLRMLTYIRGLSQLSTPRLHTVDRGLSTEWKRLLPSPRTRDP